MYFIENGTYKWNPIEVKTVIPHPVYELETIKKYASHNFAIITLKENNPHWYSMKGRTDSALIYEHSHFQIIGYGRFDTNIGIGDVCQVDLPVHSNCHSYPNLWPKSPVSIYIGYGVRSVYKDCNTCAGEFGAPAFIYNKNAIATFVGMATCSSNTRHYNPNPFLHTFQYEEMLFQLDLHE